MEELRAGLSMAKDFGIEAHELAPQEVKTYWPHAEVGDLVGATIFPHDATVNPGDAALALAKGAKDRGARFVFGLSVTGFERRGGRIAGVITDRGTIGCELAVLTSGLWTSELARLAGASVSLYPAEHVWVMTDETPVANEALPVLRDLDGYLYVRHYRGRLVVGAFEPKGKPKAPGDIDTDGFVEFGEDWEHFAPVLANARERLPVLNGIGFEHYLRGPESFTPMRTSTSASSRSSRPLDRRRVQLAGHHLQPGRRQGARRVGRRGPPDDGSHRGRHREDRPVGEQPRVAAREDVGDPRPPLRDALAGAPALIRARRPPSAPRGSVPRRRRCVRGGGGLGAARVVRARSDGGAGLALRLRAAVVVRAGRGGDGGRPWRVALFDLTTYSKFIVQGLERGGRLAVALRVRRRRPDRPGRLHAPVQRPRRHRDGPDGDAARRADLPGGRADRVPTTHRRRSSEQGCRPTRPSPT